MMKTVARLLLVALAGALLLGGGGHSFADDPVPIPDLPVSQAAEAAHQVAADQASSDWRLDPAIFTDISPVNAPDIAVKLPEDQREER